MTEAELITRIERIEKAVATIAAWLAQTPGVWGQQDHDGIMRILRGEE